MDMIQPLAKYVIDPLLALREKSSHRFWLTFMSKAQFWSKDQLENWQLDRLKKILVHANENCPFYTERFKTYGFDPNEFKTFDDLNNFPILTKKEIQNNLESLTARNYDKAQMYLNRTGGSTGSPLEFYVDSERLFSRKAATLRHDRWAGVDIGDKVAVLWGARADFVGQPNFKTKLRAKLLDRRIFLDTSDINKAKMDDFIARLNSFKPKAYLAYANSLFLFARYLEEKQIKLNSYPQTIITSAELLEPVQRELIEKVFHAPVFNRYGCRETSVLASECSEHKGLHIAAESLYVEFLDEKNIYKQKNGGEIIVTDLLNFGMPLIRYQIGDVGRRLDEPCPCGRVLPLMEISGGRMTDFLVTAEGKVVSGAALTIYFIANVKGIAQAQIIQEQKEQIILKIVKGPEFSDKTNAEIGEKVAYFFGAAMKYQLEFVEKIPATASGKYAFSISKLDPMEYLD